MTKINYLRSLFTCLVLISLIFTGCTADRDIITHVSEKEANIILVLLESRGIPAMKTAVATSAMAGDSGPPKYLITVPQKFAIEAIAYLNQNGFPKEKGTTLLELFAKQGLMTSDKEETIRYQAGLAQQLNNTIMMIDGVIGADVQISFPTEDSKSIGEETERSPITAAIYVKHQGIIDDPNAHLENKIKRLISGSITGLDINNVTVVSDRSRFTDITLEQIPGSSGKYPGEYVSVWNIVMSKNSVGLFRLFFFSIAFLAVCLAFMVGWITWKVYPIMKSSGGFKGLFSRTPFNYEQPQSELTTPSEEGE